MPRSFNLAAIQWKDPRVVMRAILGVLLIANLVMAVIAGLGEWAQPSGPTSPRDRCLKSFSGWPIQLLGVCCALIFGV